MSPRRSFFVRILCSFSYGLLPELKVYVLLHKCYQFTLCNLIYSKVMSQDFSYNTPKHFKPFLAITGLFYNEYFACSACSQNAYLPTLIHFLFFSSSPWAHFGNRVSGWLSCLPDMCRKCDFHLATMRAPKPSRVDKAHQ